MSSRRNKPSKRLRIALCVIAKNEEQFIAGCIDSARPFVDEVIVVDTGSTDNTEQIAREHGARVEHFAWCDDFSKARNAAIDHATSDWILMLDADERLDPASGPLLRGTIHSIGPNVHAMCPVIENRTTADVSISATMSVPRVFPRRRDIRYVGAIHEAVTFVPDRKQTKFAVAPSIRLIHYGYDQDVYRERGKDQRNLGLLERGLATGSDEARLRFFLLQQHLVGERHTEVVSAFERFIPVADQLPESFKVQAYHYYLLALCRLGDAEVLARAEAEAEESDALGPGAINMLSQHYASTGQLDKAIAYQERLLATDLPIDLEYSEDQGKWATWLTLAELLARRAANGDIAAAARWAASVSTAAPDSFDTQSRMLDLVIALYRSDPSVSVATPWSALDAAIASGDLQLMYDLAYTLPTSSMSALVRLHAVASRLLEDNEAEAALGLLNRALDGPRAERTYWLLVKALTQLGRYKDAQLAVEALRTHKSPLRAA